MEFLLLSTHSEWGDDPHWFFRRAACGVKNLKIARARVDDLLIAVGDGSFVIRDLANEKDLSDYGAVLICGRTEGCLEGIKAVSLYLEQWNIPVIDDYAKIYERSKLIQAVNFHMHDLPVASTVLVTQAVVANLADLPFGFPCIMKAGNASNGDSNYMVDGPEDVGRVLAEDGHTDNFVLQRYVPNSCDYRILVAGNDLLIIKRSAVDGSHLNNVAKGAGAELVSPETLPSKVVEQARNFVRETGMTIAGVDVIFDSETGSCSFLEVNAQPDLVGSTFQFEKFELIAGLLGELAGRAGGRGRVRTCDRSGVSRVLFR